MILFSVSRAINRPILTVFWCVSGSLETLDHMMCGDPIAFYPIGACALHVGAEALRGFAWQKIANATGHGPDCGRGNNVRPTAPFCSAECLARRTPRKAELVVGIWHPDKTALEYLVARGRSAVTARIGFQKYYDLAKGDPRRLRQMQHGQGSHG